MRHRVLGPQASSPRPQRASRQLRLACAVMLSLACLAGVAAISFHQAPKPSQVQMRNGTAWVASNQIGEVTLLDGVSSEVDARVTVAPDRAHLTVTHVGMDAYVVNQNSGEATRVDGATHRALPQTNLLADLHQPASRARGPVEWDRLLIGKSALYQLDPIAGRLAPADKHSLTRLGASIAVPPGSRGTTTGDGLVWVLDAHTGELHRYGDRTKAVETYRPRPTGAQEVVNVAGRPVLLDYRSGTATMVDTDTGAAADALAADLTEHDIASGSDETQRLIIVRPLQGAVSVCRFGERACRAPIFLTNGAAKLGAAIEVSDHVLIPDFGQGKVWIVDLATMATVASAELFDPYRRPGWFDLISRDGIAFFNDPDSERAGVIELNGTVRRITKYNSAGPKATSKAAGSPTGRAALTPSPTQRAGERGAAAPSGVPQPTRAGTPGAGNGSPPTRMHILRLDFSPSLPEIGEAVTVSAVTVGGTPHQWQWTVRRAHQTIVTSSQETELTHTFDAAGTYTVTLTASAGDVTDTHTDQLLVTPIVPPLRCGDTITSSVRLHVDLTCPPGSDGLKVGADDVVIDLDGHTLASSPGTHGTGLAIGEAKSTGRDKPWMEIVPRSNVTVRNGAISGFRVGIEIIGDTVSVIDLQILAKPSRSAVTEPSFGIHLFSSSEITIQDGTVHADLPVTIYTSADVLITGETISGTLGSTGSSMMELDAAQRVTVQDSSLVDVSVNILHSPATIIQHCRVTESDITVSQPADTRVVNNQFRSSHFVLEVNRFGNEVKAVDITGNSFDSAAAAGVFINIEVGAHVTGMVIAGNTFSNNGRPAGERDRAGSLVNDGLHITAEAGADITVADNHTSRNADHGIEAEPGTVIDGGGNTSSSDPNGCRGVACA